MSSTPLMRFLMEEPTHTRRNLICNYQEAGAEKGVSKKSKKERITARSISCQRDWEGLVGLRDEEVALSSNLLKQKR